MRKRRKVPRWTDVEPIETFQTDPIGVFRRSRKFDLVYKILLAEAWKEGNPEAIRRAETDYLEMQRARLSFFEGHPLRTTPGDFISAFRCTAKSMLDEGFLPDAPPIPLETGTMELLNGAHRLACCVAFGITCRFAAYPQVYVGGIGGSTFRAFKKGMIAVSVENRGVREYLKRNPDARMIVVENVSGATEEKLISETEARYGAIVWHSRPSGAVCVMTISFPDGVPPDAPDREESFRLAETHFPDFPDPDWRDRAHLMRPDRIPNLLTRLKYGISLMFKTGRKREKARLHMLELKCREVAFDRLADYIDKNVPSPGL